MAPGSQTYSLMIEMNKCNLAIKVNLFTSKLRLSFKFKLLTDIIIITNHLPSIYKNN